MRCLSLSSNREWKTVKMLVLPLINGEVLDCAFQFNENDVKLFLNFLSAYYSVKIRTLWQIGKKSGSRKGFRIKMKN